MKVLIKRLWSGLLRDQLEEEDKKNSSNLGGGRRS